MATGRRDGPRGRRQRDRPPGDALITAPGSDDERSDWTGEELEADEAVQFEAVTQGAESAAPRDEAAAALWRSEQMLLDRMEEI